MLYLHLIESSWSPAMLGYNDQIHFLGKDTGEREVAWQGHKAGEEKS